MEYERMLDKETRPSESDIAQNIGERTHLWTRIHEYVAASYDFEREKKFYAKKYGWMVRYRKSGRTLCSFFPEAGAFSVLIVLGGKESAKVGAEKEALNTNVRSVFEQTEQLHDGKWMWFRILNESDIESLKMLLNAKKKPTTLQNQKKSNKDKRQHHKIKGDKAMFEIISEGNVYETIKDNIIASLPRTAVLPDGKIACSFSVRSGPISIDTIPMISYSDNGESWSDAKSLWPKLSNKEALHMSIRCGLNGQISMAGMHAYMTSPNEINWSDEVQGMKENRLAFSLSEDGIHFSPLALVPLPYYASAEQPAGMLVDADGTLWMVYAPYPTIEQRETTITNQLVLLKSSDQGKTFTTSVFGNMQSDALYAETWLVRLRNNTMMVSTWQTSDTKNPDQYFLSFDDGETFTNPLPMPFKGQTTSLEPYGESGVLIPYNQRQKPMPGVWLALAYPDKTDFNMTENQSVWQAESLTRSQTSGDFADWTDFAFGEPHVTVLPDKTLLLTFWYEQAPVKGIRYLHLKHII